MVMALLGLSVVAAAAPQEGACTTSCEALAGIEESCVASLGESDELCESLATTVEMCGDAEDEDDCQAMCDAIGELEDACEQHVGDGEDPLCVDIDTFGDACSDDLDEPDDGSQDGGDDDDDDTHHGSCGCSSAPGGPWVLAGVGLALIVSRRRRAWA